jgi:hypothetical protein
MELVPMRDTMARLRDRWSDPLLTAVFGQLYPATLLARLVTLETSHSSKPGD